MSSSYLNDGYDPDIHVQHRRRLSPPPIRHVPSPSALRSYHDFPIATTHTRPEQHTLVVARPRSREPSRGPLRERRSPPLAPNQPVIINDRSYNEHLSEEDDVFDDHCRSYHQHNTSHHRCRSRSIHRSRSPGPRFRSRSRSNPPLLRPEDWEAERARVELQQFRIVKSREKEDLVQEYGDAVELRRAKAELDVIRRREEREALASAISQEIEFKRLQQEEEESKANRLRDKLAEEAVEKYKKQESERLAQEKMLKEESEKEYKRRLEKDLMKSGLDAKAIAAILNQEKLPISAPAPPQVAAVESSFSVHEHTSQAASIERPTYTRMARKYLSIETLREFHIEYDIDIDSEYLLIKRWVPEWEQDQLWQHTKQIRERRGKLLMVEQKKHHHHKEKGPEFEWVRKKHDRRRSKSPGLLMYLAGAKPA